MTKHKALPKISVCLGLILATIIGSALPISATPTTRRASAARSSIERLDDIGYEVAPSITEGLRRLPTFAKGGRIESVYSNRRSLETHSARILAINELLTILRLNGILDKGNPVARPTIDTVESLRSTREKTGHTPYPYKFPELEGYLTSSLGSAYSQSDVIDLAALLILDLEGDSTEPNCRESCGLPAAVLAYTLLMHSTQRASTCEAELNLIHLHSLGTVKNLEAMEAHGAAAMDACPSDPTPAWLLAQNYLEIYSQNYLEIYSLYGQGQDRYFGAAQKWFSILDSTFPQSALGPAGEADLRLKAADLAEKTGYAPFQVRTWRHEALNLAISAKSKSRSASVARTVVSALTANHLMTESIRLARAIAIQDPHQLESHELLIDALGRGKQFGEVAQAVSLASKAESPSASTHQIGPAFGMSLSGIRVQGPYDPSWTSATGGADSTDLEFLPRYGIWPLRRTCIDGALGLSLLAQGDLSRLVQMAKNDWPSASHVQLQSSSCPDPETWRDYAILELMDMDAWNKFHKGQDVGLDGQQGGHESSLTSTFESLVQLWQGLDDHSHALKVAEGWLSILPKNWTALARRAEMYLLDAEPNSALELIRAARTSLDQSKPTSIHGMVYGSWGVDAAAAKKHLALLEGYAHELAGRYPLAMNSYLQAEKFQSYQYPGIGFLSAGTLALRDRDFGVAETLLAKSLIAYRGDLPESRLDIRRDSYVFRGSQANNLALAAARNGHSQNASKIAQLAVWSDPSSPVFSDTLAFVLDLSGESEQAIAAYRAALDADPSSYPTANNLAVRLARKGDRVSALVLLEKAVSDAPHYGVAWHNLGVLLSEDLSLRGFISSQGAHARASLLDPRWRGAVNELESDTEIYTSSIDASKSIPSQWGYADRAAIPGAPLSLAVLILGLLQVASAVGLDRVGDYFGQRILRWKGAGPLAGWQVARIPAYVGLLGSMLVLTTSAFDAGAPLTNIAVAIVVLIVCILPIVIRRRFGGRTHMTWAPSILVAAVGAPLGYSFAPYPVAAAQNLTRGARWGPSAGLACLATIVLTVTLVTGIPIARNGFAIIIAVTTTHLLPITPFDGSHISSRFIRLLIGIFITFSAVALQVHWI